MATENWSTWKERILIAVLAGAVTHAGWLIFFIKDIPTWDELEKNPPILNSQHIPNLKYIVRQSATSQSLLNNMVTQQAIMTKTQNYLTDATYKLEISIQSLTQQMIDVKVAIAKLKI